MTEPHIRVDGNRVSRPLADLLLVVREEEGVAFRVNDGRRTMEEQRQRVRQYGAYSSSNPTGAAQPNPSAPHIREGSDFHALDIDQYAGDGVDAVIRAAALRGWRLVKTVPTEGWHVELDRGQEAALREWSRGRRERLRLRRERLRRELKRLRGRARRVARRIARKRAALKAARP